MVIERLWGGLTPALTLFVGAFTTIMGVVGEAWPEAIIPGERLTV